MPSLGINLANIDPPEVATPPPAAPALAPLPPARDGFTRAPKEEDVLVCPSCNDELTLGDNEVKRQVWVIKACGHVCYAVICGVCDITNAFNRFIVANVQNEILGLHQRREVARHRREAKPDRSASAW